MGDPAIPTWQVTTRVMYLLHEAGMVYLGKLVYLSRLFTHAQLPVIFVVHAIRLDRQACLQCRKA